MNRIDAWGVQFAPLLTWLLQSSLWAAAVAVLVLAAQVLFGRWLTPAWRYRLWGLVVLRLLIPTTPASPIGLANIGRGMSWPKFESAVSAPIRAPAVRQARPIDLTPTGDTQPPVTVTYLAPPPLEIAPSAPAPIKMSPIVPVRKASHAWSAIAAIYLSGAIILLGRLLLSNIRLAHRLRRAQRVEDPGMLALLDACCREMGLSRRPDLLVSDVVSVPAAAGVFRVKILFPPGLADSLSAADRRSILLHELAHVRCHDVAGNWLLAILHAVHWFNPIVWLALGQMRAEREIARDAMVLRHVAGNEARDYGQTLLKLAGSVGCRPVFSMAASAGLAGIVGLRRHPGLPGLLGGRAKLQRRLHMIASFNRTGHRFAIAGPIVAFVLAGCALTGAKPPESSASPDAPPTSVAAASPAPATQPAANVAELTAKSKQLIKEGKYLESLHAIDAILQMDPKSEYAIGVRPMVEDKAKFAEVNRAKEERLAAPSGESKEDRTIHDQLDHTLPEVSFDGVGFADVIDFLRDVNGANIFVNWKSLEAAGINKNAPVSAKLRNIKFSKALSIILDSVGGGANRLVYTIDEGVITITTVKDSAKNAVTRVYDVRDLLAIAPDFDPELFPKLSPPTTRPAHAAVQPPNDDATHKVLVDQIIRLIEETVAPESWRDAHGDVGSLRELQGQLIVTQTPENHLQIHRLLDQLRETRRLQISIEARFLSCDDQVVRDLIARWGKTAQPVIQPRADHAPATQPDSKIAGVYLNPAQVDELLHVVQASSTSALVGAPRITLFNGQRAYVKVGSSQAYVKDYTTTRTNAGDTRFDPLFDQADHGMTVDVRATVSADATFVTLTLRSTASVLQEMKEIPWPSRPPGSNLTIQQPMVKTSSLQTTLSVPNSGFVLLGGMEDPGISTTFPHTAPPAGHLRGMFILVKPTIIHQE